MSILATRILLATDGAKEAELAATTAAGLTRTTGSGLHVVNVEGARDVLDEQVRKRTWAERSHEAKRGRGCSQGGVEPCRVGELA